ncbi:cobalamin B12-binding domain-containing protein [Candidatus Symbiobacter mobilis]|uniref:Cobalamin binding-like protein n=1 Tax=Candidatus Symbiobacter mobilis CR TaxID=946483 RepID=U5NB25_9BURK|nr:cobalamin-dependent protein [Candidatus Symbiobacter mobilis]AGX88622.1 cobalamin binding-like protein [Candidatus Symbiobacter mobilis CR]
MAPDAALLTLDAQGLQRFLAMQDEAVLAVIQRFYETHAAAYERFGASGRASCRDDLHFHLEFLRPVLEFGLIQPMVDYLVWLDSVLSSRSVPSEHLAQSLDWLGEFFAQHMEPPAGAVVAGALAQVKKGFLAAGRSMVAPQCTQPAWSQAQDFERALLKGDQGAAMAVLNTMMDEGCSLVDVEMHVIQPALYAIGDKWQRNEISVAQEHMATAIVQMVMTFGLVRSAPPSLTDRRVLLACVEGNHHAVGLSMVSDAFSLAGWQVQYLGANVPTAALVAHVPEYRPHLVGLSVSFPQHLRVARQVICKLQETMGKERPPVMIGGLAINRFGALADAMGADAQGIDAQAAVEQAQQMVQAQRIVIGQGT